MNKNKVSLKHYRRAERLLSEGIVDLGFARRSAEAVADMDAIDRAFVTISSSFEKLTADPQKKALLQAANRGIAMFRHV